MSKPTKSTTKSTQSIENLESDLELGTVNSPKKEFYLAVMNMSWQLAIVVLLPLYVGSRLDNHYNTSPVWTLVGLGIALICVAMIVWRQFQLFTPKVEKHKTKENHS